MIFVDPASVSPDIAVFVDYEGRITQFLPTVKPVEFKIELDAEKMLASMRLLSKGLESATRSLRMWSRAVSPVFPWTPIPPVSPTFSPVTRARLERMYTSQRHVHRRASRRYRRAGKSVRPLRSMFYAPSVRFHERPDGDLEAQLLAWQPTD